MKKIDGIKISKLGFIPQKIGDLIYHEGPLLSLFIDRNNSDLYYFYKWVDCDEQTNRWLIVQLNAIALKSFFYKEISLRNLLLNNPLTFVLENDGNLTETEIKIAPTDKLPEEYLPKENSYFSEKKYSEFASTYKTMVANNDIQNKLNEILKKVNLIKENQNNTQLFLNSLFTEKKANTNRESASLDKYLQEIGREELITADEEVKLAQKIKQGDQAALERLTRANLRFVVSVAKQYQNQGLSLPDLINEGNLGLIKAAQKFDETRGFKFISYAVWWIRQSILQALAEQSSIVRLPLNQVGSQNKINKAFSKLEHNIEREPSAEELAGLLDISEEKTHIFPTKVGGSKRRQH